MAESELSRVCKGKGTLPGDLDVCRLLNLAPPPGLLSSQQQRLLKSLEVLSEAMYEQLGRTGRQVVDDTVNAFVSQVEELARRFAAPLDPAFEAKR